MRKKCVRWTKSVLAALIAAFVGAQMGGTVAAQSGTPSELPRLEFSNLQYVGGFRLPNTMSNGDSFSFGGRQLAFDPARNSLFVGSRAGRVAEVSIPSPVNSTNPAALPFASFKQGFFDPTEGKLGQITGEGVALDSLLVFGGRLYGTASVFYDANNLQRVSHYSRSLQLNETGSFKGWSQVWEFGKTGFVSGTMAIVPDQWRNSLGGATVTGQCCIPIVGRTSWGPSAFAFDPGRIGDSAVTAHPLVYYDGTHPTLGPWDGSNPTYGSTITMGGLVIVAGTRTALYFGTNGTGTACYGNGTADSSLVGTIAPDGAKYCYDPTNSAKGNHAYPYRYQIWAYDLNDFAAVRTGKKQPWDVVPYGVWPFDLPTPETNVRLGNAAYDAATQTIYLSQMYADRDGYSFRPVIHTLRVDVQQQVVTPPVSAVAIDADRTSPQPAGTTVRFSAAPTGGAAPFEYKWFVHDGTAWSALTGWAAANDYEWTPTSSNAGYRVGVWVRSGGNQADAAEAAAEMKFPIESTRVTSVSLAANKTAPQAAGTTITWTATPVSGEAPHQYKWWVYNGTAWSQIGDWAGSDTFAWTPATAASYRVAVWVRSAGNTGMHEAATEAWFTVGGPGIAPAPVPPPPTAPTTPVSSVALTANKAAPQAVNTTVTWTATPVGGAAPHQYQWWVFNGTKWAAATAFGTSNTFAWTPTVVSPYHRVAVWVRSAGNFGNYEAAAEAYFAVTASVAPVPAPAPPPTARATSVSISANLIAPQRPNTTITWTATPVGGVAPHQYQWWIYDGATWISQPWTTSNTFAWKPATANSQYRIAVWVRSAGATGGLETSTEAYFAIAGAPLQ